MSYCLNCNTKLVKSQTKFCSNKCQMEYIGKIKIEQWLNGEWDGTNKNGTISRYVGNFLLKEAEFKCSKCGWNIPNPVTKYPILTINHIDGNPLNNVFDNLEVICFNCHTLTETFGNLNKQHTGRRKLGMM